jgi:hypothetical protein
MYVCLYGTMAFVKEKKDRTKNAQISMKQSDFIAAHRFVVCLVWSSMVYYKEGCVDVVS